MFEDATLSAIEGIVAEGLADGEVSAAGKRYLRRIGIETGMLEPETGEVESVHNRWKAVLQMSGISVIGGTEGD